MSAAPQVTAYLSGARAIAAAFAADGDIER
jgi:hypothetical protein